MPEHLTVGCAYMISQAEWPKLEPEPEPGRVPQPASEPEADSVMPAARWRAPAAGGEGRRLRQNAGAAGGQSGGHRRAGDPITKIIRGSRERERE